MRTKLPWVGFVTTVALVIAVATPALASTAPITPTRLPYPTGGTQVQGLGIDAANQNAQLAENIGATIKPGWKAMPALCPDAADDEPTSISVAGARTVVVDGQYGCEYLSAYNTATGALLWRHEYADMGVRTANVVGSLVYFEYDQYEGPTVLQALDLATGTVKWTSYDGDDYGQHVNTIGSGLVVNELWADNATTGAHMYTAKLQSGGVTDGTSFLAGGRLFDNNEGSVQAFNAATGAPLWTYRKASSDVTAPGGGNAAPALHNGLLYIRSLYDYPTIVLDPATGKLVRTLPTSDQPIAFDGNVAVLTKTPLNEPATVSTVNLSTGTTYWSHTLPRVVVDKYGTTEPTTLWAAPVIENGLVWIDDGIDTGTPGHVAALNEVTGATSSISVEPCGVSGGSDGELAVAQHRIFVSSSCGLLTYTAT